MLRYADPKRFHPSAALPSRSTRPFIAKLAVVQPFSYTSRERRIAEPCDCIGSSCRRIEASILLFDNIFRGFSWARTVLRMSRRVPPAPSGQSICPELSLPPLGKGRSYVVETRRQISE